MPNEEHSFSLIVEVGGRPLPDDLFARLVSGYVDNSSNVPDMFVLRFNDEYAALFDKAKISIGTQIRILVQSSGPGASSLLLSGEVTTLETELTTDGMHTVVRGLDHTHRLFSGTRVKAWHDMRASDIAGSLAHGAGLRIGRVSEMGPVLEHVAQDGVSDWEFLQRLARDVGASVRVVDGVFSFSAPVDAGGAPSGQDARQDPFILDAKQNLYTLRATVTSAGQVPEVQVRGWDVKQKRPLVGVAKPATVSALLENVDPTTLAGKFGGPPHVAASTFGVQQQCDDAAKSLAAHLAGGYAEIEGTAHGSPKLRAGAAVALVNVGSQFEGKYTLTSTRHEFSPELGYQISFGASSRSERSLYGLAAGAGTSPPVLQGVVSALVTNTRDPDDLGRVKVRFPVLSDPFVSCWARVVQMGAGAERGSVVLPEVNDEVLVAFGQDDFAQPYVLGGLYNGRDKPAVPWKDHVHGNDGSVKRRAFVSRSGMLIEFLESPAGEQLNLSTSNGAQRVSLVQKSDAAIQIVSEGPVEVTAKKDVTVETASGNVAIKGVKVAIEAKGALELTGATVKVTGKGSAEVKAPAVKVAADANAELTSGAMTTVRGGIVKIN